MATATVSQSSLTPRTEISEVEMSPPSRREFLFYIWGASMFMLVGQFTAIGLWFAFPRFREGEFGGVFPFDPAALPAAGAAPVSVPSGRIWMSHTSDGLLALYGVCTHLGCLPKWVSTNTRFECPCHGSKFELNGKYIEGPAPRSLDRFRATIVFTNGETAVTNDAGDPIPLNEREIAEIRIDTGNRILRSGRI